MNHMLKWCVSRHTAATRLEPAQRVGVTRAERPRPRRARRAAAVGVVPEDIRREVLLQEHELVRRVEKIRRPLWHHAEEL